MGRQVPSRCIPMPHGHCFLATVAVSVKQMLGRGREEGTSRHALRIHPQAWPNLRIPTLEDPERHDPEGPQAGRWEGGARAALAC